MPKFFSGKEIQRILSKKYGFVSIRISGCHLIMKNSDTNRMVVVPLHEEVRVGTFSEILKQAEIEKKDFYEKSRE